MHSRDPFFHVITNTFFLRYIQYIYIDVYMCVSVYLLYGKYLSIINWHISASFPFSNFIPSVQSGTLTPNCPSMQIWLLVRIESVVSQPSCSFRSFRDFYTKICMGS
jgi:hypothetical protein